MPTGYTAGVYDGDVTELRDFAMRLARGMGALITMRDDPHDAPIPEKFEPSNWYADKLDVARSKHAKLTAMTEDECEAEAEVFYLAKCEGEASRAEKAKSVRARYQAMIAKVEAWEGAPEGIKEFALQQLRDGLKFDAPEDRPRMHLIEKSTGEEWREAQLDLINREIVFCTKEHAAEIERTNGRNAWLAQLRRSLDAYEATNPTEQPKGAAGA